jgi:hypothetical protein
MGSIRPSRPRRCYIREVSVCRERSGFGRVGHRRGSNSLFGSLPRTESGLQTVVRGMGLRLEISVGSAMRSGTRDN